MQIIKDRIQKEFETKTKAANATAALLGFIPVIFEQENKIIVVYEKQCYILAGEYSVIKESEDGVDERREGLGQES